MRRAIVLSNLRNWSRAVLAYSIVQAKVFPYGMPNCTPFPGRPNSLQGVGSEIIVFHLRESALNDPAQVESLGATSFCRPGGRVFPPDPETSELRLPWHYPQREYAYSLYRDLDFSSLMHRFPALHVGDRNHRPDRSPHRIISPNYPWTLRRKDGIVRQPSSPVRPWRNACGLHS